MTVRANGKADQRSVSGSSSHQLDVKRICLRRSRCRSRLTGGIGITPFRSILIETIRNGGLPYPVVVFYANRRPQHAAFLDEIRELAGLDSNLTFVPMMSGLDPTEPWDGERGHIDAPMLERHLAGVTGAIYYLTGPPGMIQGLPAAG